MTSAEKARIREVQRRIREVQRKIEPTLERNRATLNASRQVNDRLQRTLVTTRVQADIARSELRKLGILK
jgi:hypothetical protein